MFMVEVTIVETMLVEADIVATLVAAVVEAPGVVEDAVEAEAEAELHVIVDVMSFVVAVESLFMETEDVVMTMVDDSEVDGSVDDWLDANEGSHTCHIKRTRKTVRKSKEGQLSIKYIWLTWFWVYLCLSVSKHDRLSALLKRYRT